ncbi:LexA family protein [Leptolyngbya sp. CCNP1308]|uniref:LexA family protein n=1 Tax=Leptolyngbya sp. CCNP1308 TaxID=3110255 RepID=UPI003A598D8B
MVSIITGCRNPVRPQNLVPRPTAPFFVRVKDSSMSGVGIFAGDLLIVDRALTPTNGSIAIAVVNVCHQSLYRRCRSRTIA